MKEAVHLSGGASIYYRYPIRATVSNAGVVGIAVTDMVGISASTATSFADAVGLILDTATYSTTQADMVGGNTEGSTIGNYRTTTALDMGRVVTVSVRPDLVIEALITGAAAEGTALTTLANTAASAGGTLITDADVGTADMVGGLVWCTRGNNVGHARVITSHSSGVSFTVTVPFPRTIAVNDEFLFVPWNTYGTGATDLDGVGHVQTSTLFTQARGDIAAGTGGEAVIVYLDLKGASNSKVAFVLRDHQYNVNTN